MKTVFASQLQKGSQLWVIPFWEGPKEAAELKFLKIEGAFKDFKGKNGEVALCYEGSQRILLLGLGKQENASVEALRKAYAAALRFAFSKKIKEIEILFPKCKQKEEFFRGIAEGLFLTNYSFSYKNHSVKDDPIVLVEKVTFVGAGETEFLKGIEIITNGVHFVRDLVNANADDKLSAVLKAVKELPARVKVTIFDKKRLESEKMGLILAVSRASSVDPHLVQASYKGNPKSKEHIILVGKGITYDTGGLSIKPTEGMLSMKCDMSGAATVLGAVKVAAELGLKVNVTALMPLAENGIGSKSYKLGDVYAGYSGKTVEINNTDAEGRLVLADAMAYAVENLAPTCMIDLATLTGACVIALGEDFSGLFSNNDELAEELLESSENTDELIWRLPLHDDYKEAFKSEIADLVNSGGRDAGAIKAAIFLKEFVKEVPWAHLDIAGPAYISKGKHYHPMKGTGHGLRLLVDFLARRAS